MKIKINDLKPHPLNKIFGDLPKEEFIALKDDIKKRGMQTRVDITKDNIIVCGHQRIKALKQLGIKEVEARVLYDWDDLKVKEHLIKDNILRRQLTPFQIVEAGKELEKIYMNRFGTENYKSLEKFHKKKSSTGNQGVGTNVHTPSFLMEKGRTRDLVAKDFGITGRTYDRYTKDYEHLKEEGKKELIESEKKKEIKLRDIKKIFRKEKIEKQIEEIKQNNLQQPKGKYDIIVVDPPWKVDFDYDPDHYMGRVANPYPEMTIDQIKKIKLPVKENCILWLWTTHSQIWNAINILKEWGFEYKCILVWDKATMGIGKWLRKQCEFCLLGIKGKPIWTATNIRDIIKEQKTTHSTKPEAFYKMIDEICIGRKLDYFGRKKRSGWDVYGDEVN